MKQALAQDAKTTMQHNAALDIYSDPAQLRSTGIICTIGPKTKSVDAITQLRKNGLNIVRMNFSHGSYEYHGEVIANARQSAMQEPLDGRLVAIALDTKGPEIRTGTLECAEDPLLVKGADVTVTTDPANKAKCSGELIFMDYPNLPKVITPGSQIFIDDGLISLAVVEIGADSVKCVVLNSGKLGSHKGVNLPNIDVDLPALSEKDKADLKWGVGQDIDIVFASFIRKASDVEEVRACLVAADPVIGARIRIISKIENHEGVRNFDEILAKTDGVMVARGDLGIEIPAEKVFLAQKMMIAKCNIAGKPVICATQMLESMTFNPRPTRAEASDVANAVLDGADCVMLSGETAKGAYPNEAVAMMSRVCLEAEAAIYSKLIASDFSTIMMPPLDPNESIAQSCVTMATQLEAVMIITLTTTGNSARLISKYRPRCPILVVTRSAHVGAACNLHRGCIPMLYEKPKPAGMGELETDGEERLEWALKIAKEDQLLNPGDTVVVAHAQKGSIAKSLSTYRAITVD